MAEDTRVLARELFALQALPQSVRRARHAVARTLHAVNRGDLADTAALVTSEIVTNAVLHAGSDIGLTITVTSRGVLVEVKDTSSQGLALRSYDAGATTGRGIALVEKLVSDYGVRALPAGGKVVWFTLGAVDPAAIGVDAALLVQAGLRILELRHVPVGLYCTFQQMADGLLREYLLASTSPAALETAVDMAELAGANSAFAELAAGGEVAFSHRDGGTTHVDLELAVGADAARRFTALRQVLDRAVAMAANGLLLVPPSQPEMVALRNWCCDQTLRQLNGNAATPWQGGGPADVPQPVAVEWDVAAVADSEVAMLAADDANRLIAVSRSAAELLGWSVDELVGQRVVTIVPEPLREAHIAGFVRYLVTGESRILGAPVQVVALRSDGSEVRVLLDIEVAAAGSGRAVFTATLTPIP